MEKVCDHTSVGIMVWRGDKLLLIERAKFPKGFAVPAGHVDGDATYEDSAKRELKEEVGLDAMGLRLIAEGRKENPCRRRRSHARRGGGGSRQQPEPGHHHPGPDAVFS